MAGGRSDSDMKVVAEFRHSIQIWLRELRNNRGIDQYSFETEIVPGGWEYKGHVHYDLHDNLTFSCTLTKVPSEFKHVLKKLCLDLNVEATKVKIGDGRQTRYRCHMSSGLFPYVERNFNHGFKEITNRDDFDVSLTLKVFSPKNARVIDPAKTKKTKLFEAFVLSKPDAFFICGESDHNDDTQEKEEAHKIPISKFFLIKRSPVFKAMFDIGNTIEATTGEIHIKDYSKASLKAFWEFMAFNNKVDWRKDDYYIAKDMLALADRYEVSDLLKEATDVLKNAIKKDNVLEILKLANLVNATDLEAEAVSFVIDKGGFKSDELSVLPAELLANIMEKMMAKK